MCTLSLLRLVFDSSIEPWEISAFRAAVMDYMGWGYDGLPAPEDGGSTRAVQKGPDPAGLPANPFPYPLAQFKMLHNHGRYQPMLLCLGPRAGAVRKLFRNANQDSVLVNRHAYSMNIAEARVYRFRLQAGIGLSNYNLFKYQALNPENYRRFQQLDGESQKLAFLEKLLASHILTFAGGVGWLARAPIAISGLHILREQQVSCHNISFHCFDLNFRCNLFLPEYIGLGNDVAKGFGVVRLDRRGVN